MTSFDLSAIDTPALVLDEARMRANIRRLAEKLAPLDVVPRPHLKTAKSVEVARQLLAGGNGPATVSTLREAEYFAAAGVRDILYAVGIAPGKLGRVKALRDAGCDLAIVLDSAEQARAVADAAAHMHDTFPTLIEIDCDGHRSGLRPDDPRLVEVGRILHAGGVELRGVMTHAGDSYGAVGDEALAAFAEQERVAVVNAAGMLRQERGQVYLKTRKLGSGSPPCGSRLSMRCRLVRRDKTGVLRPLAPAPGFPSTRRTS